MHAYNQQCNVHVPFPLPPFPSLLLPSPATPSLFPPTHARCNTAQGYKQWLWDHEGKRYLDLYAGIITISVGYCHP